LLIQRIITGAIFGIVVLAAVLWLPTTGAAAVLALLFIVGAWEWAGLARLGRTPRLVYAAVFAALVASGFAWADDRGVVAPLLVIAMLGWLVALGAVLTYPRLLPLAAVGASGFLALLPPWAALTYLHGASGNGPGLVLTVFAIVWSADSGAFFTGRTFGRHKLAPKVSPGKTWEGVAGGVFFAGVVAGIAAWALGLAVGPVVAIGAATALVSVLGDLTVSIAKRNIGVKDTGRILPGHGGMLDRIDSLTAAAPAFVLGLIAARLV
jgi:phosphatidate cytidylyltransferase